MSAPGLYAITLTTSGRAATEKLGCSLSGEGHSYHFEPRPAASGLPSIADQVAHSTRVV